MHKYFSILFILLCTLTFFPTLINADVEIVGGGDADPNEYPYQVLVRAGGFLCGGTLIRDEWVLTAAHCITYSNGTPISANDTYVTLGEHDRTTPDGTEQTIQSFENFIHRDYDDNTLDNDIALIHLKSPATLNSEVSTIRLATTANRTSYQPGTSVTVTGWGVTSPGGTAADILQEANIDVLAETDCDQNPLPAGRICSGDLSGNVSVCFGDSGGPMTISSGGNPILIGVASYIITSPGNECNGSQSGYTEVASYNSWISSTIASASPLPTATLAPSPTATAAPTPTTDPTAPTPTPTLPSANSKCSDSCRSQFSTPGRCDSSCAGSAYFENPSTPADTCTIAPNTTCCCYNPLLPVPSILPTIPPQQISFSDTPRICNITSIFESLLRVSLALAGLASFLIIVASGYQWLTAGANTNQVAQAQQALTWGLIGLVVFTASYLSLELIEQFTGVSLTQFSIPLIGIQVPDCP